jgi:RND family efflux transporter MFP subunit
LLLPTTCPTTSARARQRRRVAGLVAGVVAALLLGCGDGAGALGPGGAAAGGAGVGGGPPGKGKPVVVRTQQARAERVERLVEITGTLAGAEEVVVSAEVDGRVERILADLGDVVAAGGALVQLAREIPRLQMAQADADYAAALARVGVDDAGLDSATADGVSAVRRARADRDEAQRNLARAVELSGKGVAAAADVDAARARAEITDASLALARDDALAAIATARARRAALGLARKRLEDTAITSPIDGVVAARLVGLGELVKAGQPVARVVITRRLKLRGDVPERYGDVLRVGLPIAIAVDGGGSGRGPGDDAAGEAPGVVGRLGPLIDAASRTFPIEATVDNKDGRFKPGTFVRARIVTGADEDVIALPETAVANLAGVTKVYVVDEDGRAAERRVSVLRKRGSDALVAGDLRPGERVIVTAISRVFPGAQVELDAGPPPAGSPPAGAGGAEAARVEGGGAPASPPSPSPSSPAPASSPSPSASPSLSPPPTGRGGR